MLRLLVGPWFSSPHMEHGIGENSKHQVILKHVSMCSHLDVLTSMSVTTFFTILPMGDLEHSEDMASLIMQVIKRHCWIPFLRKRVRDRESNIAQITGRHLTSHFQALFMYFCNNCFFHKGGS